ncbi:DUF1343 domain-containing protein [Balneolaceae bacterium ANBcel3]|nr:DUF1343 domain-containing protein [Balneolaceae bacterium ANBcel3]
MNSRIPLFWILSIILLSCQPTHSPATPPLVKTGLDVLIEREFSDIQGLRAGLITNPTGINRNVQPSIDVLFETEHVNLVALYGPEHGVRGDYDAGAYVASYTDKKTGLPVYSLYGPTRKPQPEMLEEIDVLIFDIQDIGVRSYTYISSMGLAMEAAAEKGIPFIVLDRPNPLGGIRTEGSLATSGYFSFVSPFPIPYIHGLTIGELARMINDEGWLKDGIQVDLTVIPMENWSREMHFDDTGLVWVPTSPHIPRHDTPFFYAITGMFGELQTVSEGVGYTLPFELFGAPWMDAGAFAARMNGYSLPGVQFRPISWRPYYGRNEGQRLEGVHIIITDYQQADLLKTGFHLMQAHHELYPGKNPFEQAENSRIQMFDRVAGSSEVRLGFMQSMRFDEIQKQFEEEARLFREKSKPYLLYE